MSSIIDCIEPDQYAVLVSLFAIAISEDLDTNEINTLGNFIVSVGSTMLTIAAQQALLEANQSNQSSPNTSYFV